MHTKSIALIKLRSDVPFLIYLYVYPKNKGCVMVKAMDCGIVVREFLLRSRYYVHFRANTPGKSMNPLILPAMG